MDGFDTTQIDFLNYLTIKSKNITCFYSEHYDIVPMVDTLNAYTRALIGALFDCGLWIPNDILNRGASLKELDMLRQAHINHERWCSGDSIVCFYGHHEIITDYLSPILSVHCECIPCRLDELDHGYI